MVKGRSVLLLVLVFITSATSLLYGQVQWKKLANNILLTDRNNPGAPAEYGAIVTKGSLVIAGWKNLVRSTDFGKTWQTLSLPISSYRIMDIDIYDVNTYIVVTAFNSAFLTQDGGLSWVDIPVTSIGCAVIFNGSPTDFLFSANRTFFAMNLTQVTNQAVGGYNFTIRKSTTGTLMSVDADNGSVAKSNDRGITWRRIGMVGTPDCYSLLVDRFDSNTIVVINEDWAQRANNQSDIYRTTDGGQTWKVTYSMPLGAETFLKGNSAIGCRDYFVGSIAGIIRSTDKGLTWNSIGGPPTPIDSKMLAAVDDSLLFVVDTFGSIWSTAPLSHTDGINDLVLGGDIGDTTYFCDTIRFSITLNEGCAVSVIDTIELLGQSGYEIVRGLSGSTLPDSIGIQFAATQLGNADTRVRVTLADGRVIFKDLHTFVRGTATQIDAPNFATDTIAFCDIGDYHIRFSAACEASKIDSVRLDAGGDAGYEIVEHVTGNGFPDSIRVRFTPSAEGKAETRLQISLNDGRILQKEVSVIVRPIPLTINAQSFLADTICSSSLDTLRINAPCAYAITGVTITGPDSASFNLVGPVSPSLPGDSLLIIACTPQHSGALNATVRLTGQDGRTYDVSLTPFIAVLPELSFVLTNSIADFTDTIGGDVTLQIKVGDAFMDASFRVSFDKLALVYQKATGSSGNDLTLAVNDSSSAHIGFSPQDSLITVHFSFFPVDSICAQVRIDSLTAMNKNLSCLQSTTLQQTAEICSPPGCGLQMLSRFVRLGVVHLDLQPNPTAGNIAVFTNRVLEHSTIQVIDASGVVVRSYSGTKLTPSGFTVNTDNLPNGVYHIRAQNDQFTGSAKFVVSK